MLSYNRAAAAAYAYKWALARNPLYYDFEKYGLGGDCTNFVSQCIYAGCGRMNYTKIFGWYYASALSRAPAWTGVEYLYKFLTSNKNAGPYGGAYPLFEALPGDIVQLSFDGEKYTHSLFVVQSLGQAPEDILIACHSYDSVDKPLSDYDYKNARLIKIDGVR